MRNLILLCILIISYPVTSQELSFDKHEIIDLTHAFSHETVYWVTAREFKLEEVAKGKTEKGYYYSANNFSTAEHGGTHIDAPIHFAENMQSLDEIPLKQLIGNGIKIDISAKALKTSDYIISIDDLKDWEKSNGKIPEQSIVLFQTGFGKFYPDAKKYLGTDKRGSEAVKELHFPGLSTEAAIWLIENRKIKAVGLDTASIDFGQSTDFATHVALMSRNIPAFENVANLDRLPSRDFQIIALPIKIKGGSGGPLRIIAIK
ncbi:cyclase family protein [Christiangramia sediminis]|uniref:Cyclase family protein n=1 Tax=Christiangramia sediminis TaxID=2881336 RepID=A0A9X1RUS4_9FLAO|nr:cyclase family protein [Christiangramia sediminis]MCB7479721.1 cyclase family protein [Christiangramia sediminis]